MHQNNWKIIGVYCDQTTESGGLLEVEHRSSNSSLLCFVFSRKTEIGPTKQ